MLKYLCQLVVLYIFREDSKSMLSIMAVLVCPKGGFK